MARYYVVPTNGPEIEVDEVDFLKLKNRMKNHKSGDWEIMGEVNTGTIIFLQNIICIKPRRSATEQEIIATESVEARKKQVKKSLAEHKDILHPEKIIGACKLSHIVNPVTRKFAENIVPRQATTPAGVVRYFPVCEKCDWKGQLIKATTIPKAFDMQPDEVPEYVLPESNED